MSCILHIETSTSVCSVSVSEDGLSIFSKEDHNGPSHAVSLGVFVDEALSFVDSHAMMLVRLLSVVGRVLIPDCVLECLWQKEFAMDGIYP